MMPESEIEELVKLFQEKEVPLRAIIVSAYIYGQEAELRHMADYAVRLANFDRVTGITAIGESVEKAEVVSNQRHNEFLERAGGCYGEDGQ